MRSEPHAIPIGLHDALRLEICLEPSSDIINGTGVCLVVCGLIDDPTYLP